MKPQADAKRPFRTHAVLLVLAATALLSCRSALRCCHRPLTTSPSPLPPSPPPPHIWNSTLLRLARNETGVPPALAEVLAFLSDPADPAARPIVIRTARTPSLVPTFRRAVRSWTRALHLDSADPSSLYSDLLGGRAQPRRYRSCAVVGNSGTLLHSRHGAAIDAHDLVVRLNNAPVAGFQQHVGSRTDLAFVNSNVLSLCNRGGCCRCHPYGDAVPIVIYLCQAPHLLDYAACSAAGAPILATDTRFDRLCARLIKYYSLKRFVEQTGRPPEQWAETHDVAMFHYSSGMQAVMMAVGVCERVSLYGFGKAAGARHHYHSHQARELDLHDYEAEYELYADLAGRPAAVPFLADAGLKVPSVEIHR